MNKHRGLLLIMLMSYILPCMLTAQTKPSILDVRPIETMLDLKSLRPSVNNTRAYVQGYHTVNDGGGGDFAWSSSSTAPDNAGTIIAPDNSPVTGRWIRSNVTEANVLHFGAIASATVDSYSSFSKALEYANTVGKPLFIPAGEYGLSQGLYSTRSTIIRGAGLRWTKLYALDTMDAMIGFATDTASVNYTLFSVIEGVRLMCQGLASSGVKGVLAHANFNDVSVNSSTLYAFDISFGWCNTFTRCIATTGLHGIYIHNNANNVNINECRVYGNTGIGILVAGYNVNINNTNIEQNDQTGIYIYDGGSDSTARFNVNHCYFEQNASAGFTFSDITVGTVKSHIIVNQIDPINFPDSLTDWDASGTRRMFLSVKNPYVYPAPQLNTISLTYGSFTPVEFNFPNSDIPNFGYWVRGQRVVNHNATASVATEWVCTNDGAHVGESDGHPATFSWLTVSYPTLNYASPTTTLVTVPYEYNVSSWSLQLSGGNVTEVDLP